MDEDAGQDSFLDEWDESEAEDDEAVALFTGLESVTQQCFQKATRTRRGGSLPGKAPNKRRDFRARYERMVEQYIGPNPIYNADDFRRRFRMSKTLFVCILDGVLTTDSYFEQRSSEFKIFRSVVITTTRRRHNKKPKSNRSRQVMIRSNLRSEILCSLLSSTH
ncbi:hypothetical protein GN958_ATG23100 [Phytophthora infestans]|uniref:Uncharacterized protein n=1 Tax=Phytophthora infestans TaxID=4787 RepID=A0A8S9TMB7_PHYIN|nr:hypothetical protein GN958_ATG23100 [Phytophthora infestans]